MRTTILLLTIILALPLCGGQALGQENNRTAQKKNPMKIHRMRIERYRDTCRASPDPIVQENDTLYLLFDLTDTLQEHSENYSCIWWGFGKKKKVLRGDRWLSFETVGKPRKLTKDDLLEINWVTKEELEALHDREYVRMYEIYQKYRQTRDMQFYPRRWENFPLGFYFDAIYMIIPRHDGIFLWKVEANGPGIV